jgi:hypothetical protein
MPIQTVTIEAFGDLLSQGNLTGVLTVNIAAELLGLTPDALLKMDRAELVRVEGQSIAFVVKADWARRELLARRERKAALIKLNKDSVRDHIESWLACNTQRTDNGLMEYGAHLMNPLGLQSGVTPARTKIGQLLGELSTESFYAHQILLSAVVVRKDTRRPSEGFWNLVESLGFVIDDDDKDAFWRDQVELVHDYIAQSVTCTCEKCAVAAFRQPPGVVVPVGPAFAGELAFDDAQFAPLVIKYLAPGHGGLHFCAQYLDGANGQLTLQGVAFATGRNRYTGKTVYQTGWLPLNGMTGDLSEDSYATLSFTRDEAGEQCHLRGEWRDETDEHYAFAGDIDLLTE